MIVAGTAICQPGLGAARLAVTLISFIVVATVSSSISGVSGLLSTEMLTMKFVPVDVTARGVLTPPVSKGSVIVGVNLLARNFSTSCCNTAKAFDRVLFPAL